MGNGKCSSSYIVSFFFDLNSFKVSIVPFGIFQPGSYEYSTVYQHRKANSKLLSSDSICWVVFSHANNVMFTTLKHI